MYEHWTYDGFPYGPYQELNRRIEGSIAPDDVILHSNKLTMLPAVYYNRSLIGKYLADPPGSGSDTLAPATQNVLQLIAEPSLEVAVQGASRVWFIIFTKAIQEYQGIGDGTHPHLAWLEDHLYLEEIETWGDLRLYIFSSDLPEREL